MRAHRRWVLILAAIGLPLAAAGCGERTQVTVYKQGKYQGKPDSQPWANAQFQSKGAWEKQIMARNQAQDEYARIGK